MRDGDDMAIDERAPFDPCVIVFNDPKRTEMILRDCSVVWVDPENKDFELGYDVETGELVSVRVYGDVANRKRRRLHHAGRRRR